MGHIFETPLAWANLGRRPGGARGAKGGGATGRANSGAPGGHAGAAAGSLHLKRAPCPRAQPRNCRCPLILLSERRGFPGLGRITSVHSLCFQHCGVRREIHQLLAAVPIEHETHAIWRALARLSLLMKSLFSSMHSHGLLDSERLHGVGNLGWPTMYGGPPCPKRPKYRAGEASHFFCFISLIGAQSLLRGMVCKSSCASQSCFALASIFTPATK